MDVPSTFAILRRTYGFTEAVNQYVAQNDSLPPELAEGDLASEARGLRNLSERASQLLELHAS